MMQSNNTAWMRRCVVVGMMAMSIQSVVVVTALTSPIPVTTLLQQYDASIKTLQNVAKSRDGIDMTQLPYSNPIFFLRYCLSSSSESSTDEMMIQKLNDALDWRLSSSVGQQIRGTAAAAIEEATSSGGWKNDVVLLSAPHSSAIRPFITPQNCITTTSTSGDLVYCIRAGSIDDVALMKAVSIDQLVEFFLYVKEINCMVCDQRSLSTNQLIHTITCNDLSGVKLIGGSAEFRKALSTSSNLAATIYPSSYTGPTLLVNLPPLLSALVQLFTPLFPESVKARLKFPGQLLQGVTDLSLIASSASPTSPERQTFIQQLSAILEK